MNIMTTTRLSRNISHAQKSIKLHTRKRDSWKNTLLKHQKDAKQQKDQIKKNLRGAVRNMVLAYITADAERYREKYQRKIDWHQGRIDVYKERLKTLQAKAKR